MKFYIYIQFFFSKTLKFLEKQNLYFTMTSLSIFTPFHKLNIIIKARNTSENFTEHQVFQKISRFD